MRQVYQYRNARYVAISQPRRDWLRVSSMPAAIQRIMTFRVSVCLILPVGAGIFWLALHLVSWLLLGTQVSLIKHRSRLYSVTSGALILIRLPAFWPRCSCAP